MEHTHWFEVNEAGILYCKTCPYTSVWFSSDTLYVVEKAVSDGRTVPPPAEGSS